LDNSDSVTITSDATDDDTLQLVYSDADSVDYVLATDGDSADYILPTGGGGSVEWTDIAVDGITLDFTNCSKDGQILTYSNGTIKCEDLPSPIKEVQLNTLTISSVLATVLITIIVSKWIVPKINWRTLVRGFFHLIYRPAKTELDEVKAEWKDVKGDE